MAVEENYGRLKSKTLYKIQLYLLKVIPMVMAFICLVNTVLSYYDIDCGFLSYLGSCSILMIAYLYVSSYVFRFCEYYRMFLHYIVINLILNTYDLYIGIPLNDRDLFIMYLTITGVIMFLILYLYVKNNKKSVTEDN